MYTFLIYTPVMSVKIAFLYEGFNIIVMAFHDIYYDDIYANDIYDADIYDTIFMMTIFMMTIFMMKYSMQNHVWTLYKITVK